MIVARLVHFAGSVQGVGFRYTARQLAEYRQVTGYVMNLSDGRVEILAEGQQSEVEAFIDEISREMADYIGEVQTKDLPPAGSYKQFVIRFYS